MSFVALTAFTTTMVPSCSSLNQANRKIHPSTALNHLHVTTKHLSRPSLPRLNAAAEAAAPSSDGKLSWWQKEHPDNVEHITDGVQGFVDCLANAQDKLVVVDFFAPWCNGCRALYPKLMKIAASHEDVKFVCVNIEENKDLARGLGVKVLPYFILYHGPEGKVDAFPASMSKSSKIVEAIEKHTTPRCFLPTPEALPVLEEFPAVQPHLLD